MVKSSKIIGDLIDGAELNLNTTMSGGVVSLDMLAMLTSIPFCARATSFKAVKNPFWSR